MHSDGPTAHALLREGEEHCCGVCRSGAEEASLDSHLAVISVNFNRFNLIDRNRLYFLLKGSQFTQF